MRFFEALNLRQGEIIALIGGGGKTTTMYKIAEEASVRGWKTLITTTTKIFIPTQDHYEVLIESNPTHLSANAKQRLKPGTPVIVGSGVSNDGKLLGVHQDGIIDILHQTGSDLMIIEADGAAHKSLKAPATHEPVIPKQTSLVIPVVGINCLGQIMSPETVHRPEIITQLTGVQQGQIISAHLIAQIFTHPLGYRKGLPPECKWIPFINQVRSPKDLDLAKEVADFIGRDLPCTVIAGSARNIDPVQAIWSFTFVP